jgi:hypothetical protein
MQALGTSEVSRFFAKKLDAQAMRSLAATVFGVPGLPALSAARRIGMDIHKAVASNAPLTMRTLVAVHGPARLLADVPLQHSPAAVARLGGRKAESLAL